MALTTNKKPRRLSFWSYFLLLINIGVLLLLASGFAAAYIPPDRNWMFGFAGLIFPYAVIANLIFVFIWMFLWRKLFLISLIALLICWTRLTNYVQVSGNNDKKNENILQVISYNVQIFDLYNWKKDRISEKGHSIIQFIRDRKPDFLCLQEYHGGKKGKVDIVDSLKKETGLKYEQIAYVKKDGRRQAYGIATFSKWPVINRKVIDFEGNPVNFCIYSDIVVNEDTLRLFNVHLESIRLSKEDYLYVTDLPKATDNQELFAENSRKILRKFKRAFIARAPQARKVAELIEKSPYPVILCGDFNDTPSSYTYHHLTKHLKDSYKESGSGIGMTYAGALPSFRIDYILHDETIRSVHYKTVRNDLSDHYPISTGLILH
ncbi:MAG TPA: endonuclease/exonuclease/phosphatase family protein [Lentimicrobium sp.]|nr:endonuclease/exonuclease/phosphatase family protein [Lentimicrobium sp.]